MSDLGGSLDDVFAVVQNEHAAAWLEGVDDRLGEGRAVSFRDREDLGNGMWHVARGLDLAEFDEPRVARIVDSSGCGQGESRLSDPARANQCQKPAGRIAELANNLGEFPLAADE